MYHYCANILPPHIFHSYYLCCGTYVVVVSEDQTFHNSFRTFFEKTPAKATNPLSLGACLWIS